MGSMAFEKIKAATRFGGRDKGKRESVVSVSKIFHQRLGGGGGPLDRGGQNKERWLKPVRNKQTGGCDQRGPRRFKIVWRGILVCQGQTIFKTFGFEGWFPGFVPTSKTSRVTFLYNCLTVKKSKAPSSRLASFST